MSKLFHFGSTGGTRRIRRTSPVSGKVFYSDDGGQTWTAEEETTEGKTEIGPALELPVDGLIELDEYLMFQDQMPKDLALQLSKSGTNTVGGPKLSLELGIGISDRIFMSDDAKKEARARYGSYPDDLRLNALSEVEAEVLVKYLTNTSLEDLLSSQRSLRRAFQKRKSSNAISTPQAFLLDVRGKASPEKPSFDVPLVAFEVVFEDQNGEIREMEYQISCRGTLNFVEAYNMTKGGLNTSRMSVTRVFEENGVVGTTPANMNARQGIEITDFPRNFANGTMKDNSFYHLLYQWGSKNRGSVEIEISTPEMIDGTEWAHERISAYDRVLNKNYDTEFAGTKKAKSKTVLFRDQFKVDGLEPEVIRIKIPIYVEPLPNHLVMTSDGIKSKWEMTGDVNNLADHQKVELNLRLARPRSSEMWEKADFDGDFVISYDEYISPEGVAARRAGRSGASPVPNTQLLFVPDPTNSWLSAKKTYQAHSNISGYLNITLPPGRWTVTRVSGDKLVKVDDDYEGAKAYINLSLYEKSLVDEEYGDQAQNFSYAPNTVPMAKISVPAAFYWRTTDEYDTTPTGVVGAKVIQDLTGVSQDVMSSFELRDNIPPLAHGKPATTDTIYQKLVGMYPTVEKSGYPIISMGTMATSRQVFDTAVMYFKEDSPYDLSQVGMYERQLESEYDSSVEGFKDVQMPVINETIDYNGYKIRRVIVDTSIIQDENSLYTPHADWDGFTEEHPPLRYFPTTITANFNETDLVAESPGDEYIQNITLPFLSQHRSDGQSFEALVYYKEHKDYENAEIISLYNVPFGTRMKERFDAYIDEARAEGEEPNPMFYSTQDNEAHFFSNPSSAIIAGQFVPLQAPSHHQGWHDVTELLKNQTESQAMIEVFKKIDSGGVPKFPAGEVGTYIHNYMRSPPRVMLYEHETSALTATETTVDFSQVDTSELGASANGDPGDYYPGALVFFEADMFPTASGYRPWPFGYQLDSSLFGAPTPGLGAAQYRGEAQANIEFLQDVGGIIAPQPYGDEEDEYNMGYGLI